MTNDNRYSIISPVKITAKVAVGLRYLTDPIKSTIEISKNFSNRRVSIKSIFDVLWLKIDSGDMIVFHFENSEIKLSDEDKTKIVEKIREVLSIYGCM